MIPRCERKESEVRCFLDTSTKASKPPNQKYLRLVEVPRAESLVDEIVGALLTCVCSKGEVVGRTCAADASAAGRA